MQGNGAVAQLGERLNGIQEADGSIPFGSTTPRLRQNFPCRHLVIRVNLKSPMLKPPKLRRTLLTSRVCVVLACLACGSLDNIIVRKSGSTTLPAGSPVSILTQLGFVELA